MAKQPKIKTCVLVLKTFLGYEKMGELVRTVGAILECQYLHDEIYPWKLAGEMDFPPLFFSL